MDTVYLALTFVFFALAAAVVRGCEKLEGQP
jgi:hypothetical protein